MEPDFEWLMIDSSHCKVHPHAAGPKDGNQDMSRTKGRLNTKIQLAVDANGMPVRVLITEGTQTDCKETIHLIDDISAETLLADRGYDTNKTITYAAGIGMNVVIPAKRNRKQHHNGRKERKCEHLDIVNTLFTIAQSRLRATRQ